MHQNDSLNSGNAFIDENHDNILILLEELSDLLRKNWNPELFQSTFFEFLTTLENHFLHEEVLLKGAGYADLETHTIMHRDLALKLRMKNINSFDYNFENALQLLTYTRSAIFAHELIVDQKYWHIFENEDYRSDSLINWSPEIETGNTQVDEHHRSLLRYIHRLGMNFQDSTDYAKVIRELAHLKQYVILHFEEEEQLLDEEFIILHQQNHKELLKDLNNLISEVEAKKYKLSNLGDYLNYWLLNHIKNFDVPELKK